MNEDGMKKEEFLESRKAAGRVIDPETCEVNWWWAETLDPYGIEPDLLDELRQVGRSYFVRSAESDGAVSVYDLPKDKARALHARIERGDVEKDDWPF